MTKWWLCGVAMAVMVASVSVIGGLSARAPSATTQDVSVPSVAEVRAPVTEACYGTLGVWNGKLALFCGEETPSAVYDVWASSLPPEEQKKLATGIPVANRAAFLALLQEYTG